ncbi:hypothetical protein CALVIDRAFT_562173 [Calocera viscosa TUFC12733]|uniref:Uncharacterized protein n=1 Tax=Calocera viscosa (strain TUFC12733) TaxID=1330018 RepID=A0A167NZD3_CALVF|nr:hypothetical protein CALVIDRAFT_562173 [Calocera viscosa TUFC12733]
MTSVTTLEYDFARPESSDPATLQLNARAMRTERHLSDEEWVHADDDDPRRVGDVDVVATEERKSSGAEDTVASRDIPPMDVDIDVEGMPVDAYGTFTRDWSPECDADDAVNVTHPANAEFTMDEHEYNQVPECLTYPAEEQAKHARLTEAFVLYLAESLRKGAGM